MGLLSVYLILPDVTTQHRHLQSWMGTWARLSYAAFDAIAESVFCYHTVYMYVCVCVSTHMLIYRGLCVQFL